MGRMRNVRISIGLCIAVFALVGCSKPEDAVVGTWTSNQGGVTSTTEFKADKTYTSKVATMGQNIEMSGTWSMTGKDVKITVVKVGGQDVKAFMDSTTAMMKMLPAAQREQAMQGLQQMTSGITVSLSDDKKSLTGTNGSMTKVEK
jgi:hypothetical protein